MKIDIVIAGVGGQGIVSIATTIGFAAVESGLFLKQSEVHGMSQRGGDVSSNLRLSDQEIFSDLIPKGTADMIISVEPMESLRYLPFLSPKGWLITNTKPFINIPNYPAIEKVMTEINKFPRNIAIDAEKIAEDFGSPKSANMVILGAASPFINMPVEKLEDAIKTIFKSKGEDVVNVNLKCFSEGRAFAQKKI
ncbi:MAG TPA: indolepyruvate oxidoreductase subunit beta [Bacteroidales bacterium]|nr:indolepyruvate oxidoreductase subunit beta [Bacteroidales bacterium]HQI46589.1 indolepyruvate oxidoreductase subunit beta [Bacteroidales bacterium]